MLGNGGNSSSDAVIGDAFVHDTMHGEGMKMVNFIEQNILIV